MEEEAKKTFFLRAVASMRKRTCGKGSLVWSARHRPPILPEWYRYFWLFSHLEKIKVCGNQRTAVPLAKLLHFPWD